jgi:hypothetical protein
MKMKMEEVVLTATVDYSTGFVALDLERPNQPQERIWQLDGGFSLVSRAEYARITAGQKQ